MLVHTDRIVTSRLLTTAILPVAARGDGGEDSSFHVFHFFLAYLAPKEIPQYILNAARILRAKVS